MAAAHYDFEIEQGTTVLKPFVWKDADGTPVNLTGYSARMQVRASTASEAVLLDASSDNGLLLLEPLQGRVTLALSATVTAALDWRRGRYDLEMVSSAGMVTRLLQGSFTVSPEVTRG